MKKLAYVFKKLNPFQKHLYIIGNGFDIHHGVNSRYSNYREWLHNWNRLLLDDIEEFFGRNDEEFWNEFEKNLSEVSIGVIYTEIENNIPNISSPSFRDSDYENATYAIEFHLKETFSKIKSSFKVWVESLDAPNERKKIKLRTRNSLFINFNYTDTLEKLYNISENNIEYIHGKSKRDENLVLGHGSKKENIQKNIKADSPLNRKDPDDLDVPDTLFDNALDKAVNEVCFMRKDVASIMHRLGGFFKKIKRYSFVHVYGLSFGDVDLPYLRKVIDVVGRKRIFFEISDYKGYALSRIKAFMEENGIKEKQYQIIDLASLMKCKQ